MERAENGQIHAAEVEPESTLIPEDIDLKRTDDCLFSSSGKVIAIAGFVTDSIMVFKLSYLHDADKLIVTIEGKLMVNHPLLRLPHGIDFVDKHTLAAVNREGCLWCTIGGTNDQLAMRLATERIVQNHGRRNISGGKTQRTRGLCCL